MCTKTYTLNTQALFVVGYQQITPPSLPPYLVETHLPPLDRGGGQGGGHGVGGGGCCCCWYGRGRSQHLVMGRWCCHAPPGQPAHPRPHAHVRPRVGPGVGIHVCGCAAAAPLSDGHTTRQQQQRDGGGDGGGGGRTVTHSLDTHRTRLTHHQSLQHHKISTISSFLFFLSTMTDNVNF